MLRFFDEGGFSYNLSGFANVFEAEVLAIREACQSEPEFNIVGNRQALEQCNDALNGLGGTYFERAGRALLLAVPWWTQSAFCWRLSKVQYTRATKQPLVLYGEIFSLSMPSRHITSTDCEGFWSRRV